ncbi:hypothetical protein HDK77DRAFT_490697, partial [Phyllosticta capitalensis]
SHTSSPPPSHFKPKPHLPPRHLLTSRCLLPTTNAPPPPPPPPRSPSSRRTTYLKKSGSPSLTPWARWYTSSWALLGWRPCSYGWAFLKRRLNWTRPIKIARSGSTFRPSSNSLLTLSGASPGPSNSA